MLNKTRVGAEYRTDDAHNGRVVVAVDDAGVTYLSASDEFGKIEFRSTWEQWNRWLQSKPKGESNAS